MRFLIVFLAVNLTNVLVAQTFVPISEIQQPAHKATQTDEELQRRGLLGAYPVAITAAIREREDLNENSGVMLSRIFPDTAAAEAELKVGDVVLSLDGVPVKNVADFMKSLKNRRTGETVKLEIVRDGVSLEKHATLKEFVREKNEAFDVTYAHVTSCGVRLRTIVTRPKNGGNLPAVLLLQGHGNHSIDNPLVVTGFTRVAHHLARNGYVTMRVDRRGCGDSEGDPCRYMDFETELEGYRQALKAMRALEFVDQRNIFIFGQSLGGTTGAIIAAETPVRGIITHGSGAGVSFHQILSQRLRWAELDGSDPAEVAERIRREARFWYPLVIEEKTPAQILKADPENRETILQLSDGNTQCFSKPCTWLHQATKHNMGKVWTKVASTPIALQEVAERKPLHPRVLNIWGTSDWCVGRRQNEWLTETVNRAMPGQATFVALKNSDHHFHHAESMHESFRYFKPGPKGPYGKFNPAILKTVREWLDETVRKTSDETKADQLDQHSLHP